VAKAQLKQMLEDQEDLAVAVLLLGKALVLFLADLETPHLYLLLKELTVVHQELKVLQI
jgi:hypothetical protein